MKATKNTNSRLGINQQVIALSEGRAILLLNYYIIPAWLIIPSMFSEAESFSVSILSNI